MSAFDETITSPAGPRAARQGFDFQRNEGPNMNDGPQSYEITVRVTIRNEDALRELLRTLIALGLTIRGVGPVREGP